MDRIYDLFDDDVDPVGVGGADVLAQLRVARNGYLMPSGMDNRYTNKTGILSGKKRRFVGRINDSVGRWLERKVMNISGWSRLS